MKERILPIIETQNVILIFKEKTLPITSESIREVEKALRKKGIKRKEISNITEVLKELIITEEKKRRGRRMNFITNSVEMEEKIMHALRQNPQGLTNEEIGIKVYGYPVSPMKTPVEYGVFYRLLHGLIKRGKVTTEKVRDKFTSFGGRATKVYKLAKVE